MDIIYHELMDLMNDDCPVCALMSKRLSEKIEFFLYEAVNDRGLRKEISVGGGFCNTHAYQILEAGDPLAHAILYSDLLADLSVNLRAGNVSRHTGKCVFCESAAQGEKIYTAKFAAYYEEVEEFRSKYAQSGMLCKKHITDAAVLIKKKGIREELCNKTAEKYDLLIKDLEGIRRKSDYRHSHEPWSEGERTAWKKAVAAINGCRGIK
ncbi:MAG TPA: DUF6062 family protein [Clostridia bacterium]|nr:DUF6062 family protein [Clostridia bacterium]